MSCREFERWLDDGQTVTEAAVMRAHAQTCEACGRLLEADEALARVLAVPAAQAPASFTDRVMTRIAADERRHARLPVVRDPMPLWVRVAAEPASAAAIVLTGLVVWQADAMITAVASFVDWSMRAPVEFVSASAITTDPAFVLALAAALLPITTLAAIAAYQWSRRLASHAAGLPGPGTSRNLTRPGH